MKLIDCGTLVNIEGTVYKLSQKDYDYFKEQMHSTSIKSENPWSELLHWVEEHGKRICEVESYNF